MQVSATGNAPVDLVSARTQTEQPCNVDVVPGSSRISRRTAMALSILSSVDEATTHRIAAMLSWLSLVSGDRLTASQAVLAGQPNASLRALAAVLWVHDAGRDPDLGMRLASDPNVLVRRTLASEIASSAESQPDDAVVARLATVEHYSVRKALRDLRR